MKHSRFNIRLIAVFTCFVLIQTQNAFSLEIEGVTISTAIKTDAGSLILNGSGIRTKFFFDIYIGSLYLKNKESDIEKILNSPDEKQITLHFLYKEVSKEKLTTGWTAGFKNNNSNATFESLKERLDKFNSYFDVTKKGDVITLDFLASENTRITINGKNKGQISGADFQLALLKVWLGDDPADYNLKEAMLGLSDN
ncbi:MAG: chalcone isomerase family protein [Gammaproteobacteria bacterium]